MIGPTILLLLTFAVAAEHPDKNHAHADHGPLNMSSDHYHHSSEGRMQFDSETGPQSDTHKPYRVSFPMPEMHRRLSLGDLISLVFHLGDTIDDFRAAHTIITAEQSNNDSKAANTSAAVPNMTHPQMSTLGPELKPVAAEKNSSNSTQTPSVSFPTPEINLKRAAGLETHAHESLRQNVATVSAVPAVSRSHAA